MIDSLPEAFDAARSVRGLRGARGRGRYLLHAGDDTHAILHMWADGFAVDAGLLPRLRGAVEISRGGRDLWTCLIVASRVEHGMLLCEFKRITPVHAEAPVDYIRPAEAATLRLPRA